MVIESVISSDVGSVLTDQGQENVDTMVAASFGKKSMMSAEVKSVSQAVDDDSEMMMSAVVVGLVATSATSLSFCSSTAATARTNIEKARMAKSFIFFFQTFY